MGILLPHASLCCMQLLGPSVWLQRQLRPWLRLQANQCAARARLAVFDAPEYESEQIPETTRRSVRVRTKPAVFRPTMRSDRSASPCARHQPNPRSFHKHTSWHVSVTVTPRHKLHPGAYCTLPSP